jgi:hypothetical protein
MCVCVFVCVCVCVCVYCAFVGLDNKLYKMHSTYIKIINYYCTQTQGIQCDTWFLIVLASRCHHTNNHNWKRDHPLQPTLQKIPRKYKKTF